MSKPNSLLRFCEHCGEPFLAKNPVQRFDSARCRRNNHGVRRHYYPKYGKDCGNRYEKRSDRKIKNVLTKDAELMGYALDRVYKENSIAPYKIREIGV